MTKQTQTIRLADFHNRVVDFKMKGTYGYNPTNATILTAVSYVEELEVTRTACFDDDGNELKSPIICGIDKYGREMVLPLDRILACGWVDTKEQSRLKGLETLIQTFGAIPNLQEVSPKFYDDLQGFIAERDELVAKGVKLWERA